MIYILLSFSAFIGSVFTVAVVILFPIFYYEGNFLMDNIGLISTLITFMGVMSAILYPLIKDAREKDHTAILIKKSIRLYLDALSGKAEETVSIIRENSAAIYQTRKGISHETPLPPGKIWSINIKGPCRPLPEEGQFEEENKQNHDAVEKLFLEAALLSPKERNALYEFILYFKKTPRMSIENTMDFNAYLREIRKLNRFF